MQQLNDTAPTLLDSIDTTPKLFQPMNLGPLTLANRIVIPPMCQYSAVDGNVSDWHLMHYGTLAASGAGLLILEATAVAAVGRISPRDLGLYTDANQAALSKLLGTLRQFSGNRIAIQIAHAGRKASSHVPWESGAQIAPDEDGGWMAEAPSAIPHGANEVAPMPLSRDDMDRVLGEFVAAARRADAIGFDGVEIHMAHGYLMHEFLSPLSNDRSDEYGGSLENRMRYPLEVFRAVRQAVSADKPVWVRISATDWVDGGWNVQESIVFAKALKRLGCAAIHVSSGGLSAAQQIPVETGYQVGFSEAIRTGADVQTITVGLITEPSHAEEIIASGQADAVAIGRAALYDPRWPWHAAAALGAQIDVPEQYWRCQPREVRQLFRAVRLGFR